METLDTPVFRSRVEEFQLRHETEVVTMLFSDVVGSTQLKATLGEKEGIRALLQHHEVFRKALAIIPDAEEIGTAGDSFFLVFAKPSDAVRFALLAQKDLRQLAAETGRRVLDRIGIHVGEVWVNRAETAGRGKDLFGLQVDLCARVSSLGGADQILLTRFAFDSARQVLTAEDVENLAPISWLNHGPYVMKGFEEALEVCEVGESGRAALARPADTEKARRFISPDSEPVLGWRPAVDQPVPGTSWVLEKKLGEGGFGEVWLGRDKVLKTRHVFKFCFHADRVRSLKREVTLFRLFKERVGAHPNIVGIEATYFDEPPFYIVMQYVDGSDLRAWCEAQGGIEKVPLAARLEIIAQVADGLQAAHDSGVIHRDVKPTNILVSGSGTTPGELRVKLTDFGIGQVVSEELLAGMTRSGFTRTMMSLGSQSGTQMYMAPELSAGKPASVRSDIYALGVVLYQLLVGDLSRPIATDWARDVKEAALREDLAKCFAGNPAERFASPEQLAKSLRALELKRPRNVDRKRAAAILYGDWGTSKAYVVGLAFAVAGYSSFPLIAAMCLLTALVGVNYMAICKHYPDGGGVYASVRHRSVIISIVGAFLLIADYLVTAAICALSAFQYLGWAHPEIFAAVAIVLIGALNFFGPKHSAGLAFLVSVPTAIVVVLLGAFCLPHIHEAIHNMQPLQGGLGHNWSGFVSIVLALSGVEAIANATGWMKLNPGSDETHPCVTKTSTPAIAWVMIEVCLFTALLGLGMLALPHLQVAPSPDGYDVNAPGAEGVRDYMLRYMAQVFVGGSLGATAGHIAALAVSIVFGVLLLSAVNTALIDISSVTFLMSRDSELPLIFSRLNKFGVPTAGIVFAAFVPMALVLLVGDMSGLADLYAVGVVGAIATNLGASSTNWKLPLAKWERGLMFGTFLLMLAIEITLFATKPNARVFAVTLLTFGLILRGLASERRGRGSN